MRSGPIPETLLAAVFFVIWISIAPVLHAAEGADDLYAKGRYKEAARAYRQLDMDRPGDLRYRYDRGCAAYMAGSLEEAKAAFSSVVRRSTDGDLRFRALYNLGNTAYKQNDFAAARDAYREALKVRPDDADVRHNLELSLKALREQQQNKDQEKEGGQGQDREGRDQKDDGKKEEGKGGMQDRKQGSPPGRGDDGGGGQQGKQPGKDQGSQDRRGEGKQDLSGELRVRGMQAGQGSADKGQAPDGPAVMERKKAEALLDNVGKDREGMRAFQGTRGERAVVGSGKEW